MWSLTPSGVIFDEELKTLPMVMTQISSGGLARAGCTMAASTLMMLPPILIYVFTQSNVMETMSSAGIKD
jgi:ABC-type glycerol-3-phosphate transport system permease component